jgi:hypothetical protein
MTCCYLGRISRLLCRLLLFVCYCIPTCMAAEVPDGATPPPAAKIASGQLADAPYFSSLPHWMTIGGQIRGRFERPSGVSYTPGFEDFYFASRLRLDLTVRPTSWTKFFVQGQDSRVNGYEIAARPASMHDPMELRQMYVEVGKLEGRGLRLKAGRQELSYGAGWIVSAADWGNTTRVFEAAVASANFKNSKLDLFAGSVILPDSARVDRHKPGEHLYGADLITKSLPGASVELFLMAKTQIGVTGELGVRGDATTYISGFRAAGKTLGFLDYSALAAHEWGSYAMDRISAWGGYGLLGWTVGRSTRKPRFSVEADLASGDHNAKDGVRGTFDTFYGAYHNFLGSADRLGWRNSRNLRIGFDFVPRKRCKLGFDVRDLALMRVSDGLYNATNTREALNPKAHSRHVGLEGDSTFSYEINSVTSIGLGAGHLWPGAYLKESTKGAAYTFPYLMFTRKF